jgi:dynein heavy chain
MVVEATCSEGREDALQGLHESIEKCEKALNDYLEQKKKAFPRFYFVSNQALLDILSNGNNPHKVAEYFGDCFVSLDALEFEKDSTGKMLMSSTGFFSKEGEYVKFPDNCNEGIFVCKGAVESWLCDLELMMKRVLKATLEICHKSSENLDLVGEKSRDQWIEEYPAQISLTGTCIVWTEEVHRAIDEVFEGSETAMKEYCKVCSERINKLIDRVIMPDITAELRDKFITVITVDVHSRDVVDKLAI